MYRLLIIFLANFYFSHAESLRDQIKILQEALGKQTFIINQLEQRIIELEARGDQPKSFEEIALDSYLESVEEEAPKDAKVQAPTTPRYLKSGISGLLTMGSSSERDSALELLQGGAHNPSKRGFSVRGLEWAMYGAVDPAWDANVHLLINHDPREGETIVEIEEAFIQSTALSRRLQAEAGIMNTEFGRFNALHAHQWTFVDQPLIHNRIFGSEAMRGPGVRLGYMLSSRNHSELHFGVQNASGGTMASFQNTGAHAHGAHGEEEGHEEGEENHDEETSLLEPFEGEDFVSSPEDMVYLLRWAYGWSPSDTDSARFGLSFLRGPGFLPNEFTSIMGVDLTWKKRKLLSSGKTLDLLFEGEYMQRKADALHDDEAGVVEDRGFYIQGRGYWNQNFGAGLRVERAWSASDFDEAATLANHSPRTRISPQLIYRNSEFSQFRLQYNWDDWDFLRDGKAESIWLSFDFFFGDHPAHTF
mgnify:CR=1 FL=1